ncbi:MAG TPA: cholesterol esterase, partial [Micromonosporaceae bacterium]|nr:cholesterol esterase [Micromonosporaceae bacterium]
MKDPKVATEGGTRWRRFAAAIVPTVVIVGALGAGIASGAVPVSFAVSGVQFKVTADQLTGTD